VSASNRRVFIVLGLYRPDPRLLSRQLDSLLQQTHRNVEVLACADGTHDPSTAAMLAGFSQLPIHAIRFDTQVGVHANFARGLREALRRSERDDDLFAFSDQDDFWHPTKLERQIAALEHSNASLCHSDARIVTREGDELVASLFRHESRSRSASFADLLVMNSVTGMTALFRRDVAVAAQPFPLSKSRHLLHDHWVALVASLLGSIHFLDEALVDYTQHAGNVLGAQSWQGKPPRRGAPSGRRAYLRKAYREFLWRCQALDELRGRLEPIPQARERLFGKLVGALFDCGFSGAGALWRLLEYRLRGDRRQADQIWRIWRAKSLHCARKGPRGS